MAEIAAFRQVQIAGFERDLERTVFTPFGRDLRATCTLFRRPDAPGRQLQVWARIDGWRIVHVQISIIDGTA